MVRRDFLRKTSLSGLGIAGLGSIGGFAGLGGLIARTASTETPTAGSTRWGLAILTTDFSRNPEIIKACHQAHNVPDIPDKKQKIKWIWEDNAQAAFSEGLPSRLAGELETRSFLLLCNHCANPACVRVCPTRATFKRSDGIVAMDYHRCIGCRFCMAACPYGARSFNFHNPAPYLPASHPAFPARMRGVVEKCAFCSERLPLGLAPYCVEAAKDAMIFGNLNDPDSEISHALHGRLSLTRRPELGTGPSVYYIL